MTDNETFYLVQNIQPLDLCNIQPAAPVASSWWRRLMPFAERGARFEFALVELSEALSAFEKFWNDPGEFAIETKDGVRIDFHVTRRSANVHLDLWFSDSDISEASVPVAVARQLIELIFTGGSDQTVASFLHRSAPDSKK